MELGLGKRKDESNMPIVLYQVQRTTPTTAFLTPQRTISKFSQTPCPAFRAQVGGTSQQAGQELSYAVSAALPKLEYVVECGDKIGY